MKASRFHNHGQGFVREHPHKHQEKLSHEKSTEVEGVGYPNDSGNHNGIDQVGGCAKDSALGLGFVVFVN